MTRQRHPRTPNPTGKDVIMLAPGDYAGYYDGEVVACGATRMEVEEQLDAYVYERFRRGAVVLAGELARSGEAA